MAAVRPCIGLFDRQGIPTTSTYLNWANAAYNSILGGFVIAGTATVSGGVAWSDLQPALGSGVPGTGQFTTNGLAGGTKSAGAAAIDSAFKQADNYNATNPAHPWSLKLRLFLGQYAPAWAKTLDATITGTGGATSWSWWTPNALACWKNLMTTLAAYVPAYTVTTTNYGLTVGANTQALSGHPLFGEIVQELCMTLYAEPLLKDNFDGATAPTLASLGYSWSPKDQTQHKAAVTYMPTAFPTTPWSMGFNPATNIDNSGGGGQPDEAFTEALMDHLAANGGPLAVLGNNSLRANGLVYPGTYSDPHSASYTAMYTHIASYGHGSAFTGLGAHPKITGIVRPAGFTRELPFYTQTSGLTGMGGISGLVATLDYAVWLGARMVELPSGYSGNPASSYSGYYAQLLANNPVTVGGPNTSGVVPNNGTTAGGTSVTVSGTGFVGATAVNFGATPGTSLVVTNATSLTIASPAGTGTVDVRVITPGGTSPITPADQFTYTTAALPPTVTGVSPTSVLAGNSVVVTITGSSFTGTTSVQLGALGLTGFTVTDDSHISVTVPNTVAVGTYPFTVTTPAGTSL